MNTINSALKIMIVDDCNTLRHALREELCKYYGHIYETISIKRME